MIGSAGYHLYSKKLKYEVLGGHCSLVITHYHMALNNDRTYINNTFRAILKMLKAYNDGDACTNCDGKSNYYYSMIKKFCLVNIFGNPLGPERVKLVITRTLFNITFSDYNTKVFTTVVNAIMTLNEAWESGITLEDNWSKGYHLHKIS